MKSNPLDFQTEKAFHVFLMSAEHIMAKWKQCELSLNQSAVVDFCPYML